METDWSLAQILTDCFIVLTVGLSIPLIKQTTQIFQRGFFCNDETLMRPLTAPSLIETPLFHPLGCLITIALILLVEFINNKPTKKFTISKVKLPSWMYHAYSIILTFGFGVLSTILITTIIKGSVGRLRPTFMAACVPSINCSLPLNQNVYHTNFECTNKKFKQNGRLSFPSGHSSFAMFCAVFVAIYVNKRVEGNRSKLIKSGIQLVFVFLAIYVGVSRISDYKHHWEDVVVGLFIGGCCACLISSNLYEGLATRIGGTPFAVK